MSVDYMLYAEFSEFSKAMTSRSEKAWSWFIQSTSALYTSCMNKSKLAILGMFHWIFFLVVPQALNELPSQHWTKRAKIVRWYCSRLKKQVTRHIWNSRFSDESIYVRPGPTLHIQLSCIVSDVFGQHRLNNIPILEYKIVYKIVYVISLIKVVC